MIPEYSENEIPQFHPSQVWLHLAKLNTSKSAVEGDFPPKLVKLFAAYLAEPLTDVINTSVRLGEYPNIYKFEICTPVSKSYPPQTTSQVRNISGLLTFDKIMEKLISELIISDMSSSFDPSQYGNQKGVCYPYSTILSIWFIEY